MAQNHSGTTRKGGRVPWGTITRDRIVDAAERAIRDGGYERLTIRKLAADLGASPMALYHHVRDKDDLLDEVVDRLLARVWRPGDHAGDWRAWVTEAADRLRLLLVVQPAALHVYLSHPVVTPAAVARMDALMDVLRRAMGDEMSAQQAYAAIHTYTVGFAALEASRSGWQPGEERHPPGPGRDAGSGRDVFADPPVSDSPDLVHRLAAYTTPDQFRRGLRYLLDGIQGASHEGAG